MEVGNIFSAGRLDRISQQRVFRGVRAMTAHNGADESFVEAKRIFRSGKDVGNVTENADPLSREGRNDARIQGSADTPCSLAR